MPHENIGFIGLGLMGSAMVSRLQDLDYHVTVCANKSRPNIEAAIARGAHEVETAYALARTSDIILLCMDTSGSVEARMRGPDGVIAGLRKGTIVIDFGTSLPASTRALGQEVAAAGGYYLDAPLGRTPQHALIGQLNIMAAGDTAAYERARPVLKNLAENVFHLGNLGDGHSFKLMNNFFGMTVANAMAEAFAMADQLGLDRDKLYTAMSAGPLHSGMMDFVKAYAVEKDPNQLAFSIKNAAKDVGYYTQMAQSAGVDSVMSLGALSALDTAVAEGRGEHMVSQMVDFYADRFAR